MSDVRFWSEQLPSERIAAPLDGVFRIECNNLFEFCERPSHEERLLPICSRKAQRNWKDRFSLKTLISKPANISATATVVASATICHFCSRQQVVLTSAFRVANSWVEPFSLGSSKHLGQAACFFRHTSAQNVGVSVTCVWATTAAVFRAEILVLVMKPILVVWGKHRLGDFPNVSRGFSWCLSSILKHDESVSA